MKEAWKKDFGVLRHGDERYKRPVGRVMTLTVERSDADREKWEARTFLSGRKIQLARLFATKEQAMGAIEKKAAQLLQEALEELDGGIISNLHDKPQYHIS